MIHNNDGTRVTGHNLIRVLLVAGGSIQVQPELFQALFPFELDPFQTQALRGLAERRNVIVSAPTGSGKTVVGELAVYYALALNLRCVVLVLDWFWFWF